MVQLLNGPWRGELADMALSAESSVMVVAPFIKYEEAAWLCDLLRPGVEVITLANIDADAVSAAVLDLDALRCLVEVPSSAKLIALSNLHAKVFVADDTAAIVTSGNLTGSALDRNIEYGVRFHQTEIVNQIRNDMLAFACLGSQLDLETLQGLIPLQAELRQARAEMLEKETPAAKGKFNQVLRQAKPSFAAAQVGDRSAYSVFGDAIQFVLTRGPQTTKAIQLEVSRLLPVLCDESEILYVKGEPYGKAWKRRFRHAQLNLKRKGAVTYDARTKLWGLASGTDTPVGSSSR